MAVFVLDKHRKPLMPCSEKRARLLLNRKRARVHSIYPFTIRLAYRTVKNSALQPTRCKIDPGSQTTGMALVRENGDQQIVISLVELIHRGAAIRESLMDRSAKRRRRRYHLRYREQRFSNRQKPKDWLAPSLQHRVNSTMTWVQRLKKRAPLTAISCERVRFDTQKLLNPEIAGMEYQQGTLFGYEIREYLLEKWGRQCVYCHAKGIPLQIDHILAKSSGGSNRIDNLTLACESCNLKKSNLSLEVFCPELAQKIHLKKALRDASAVNSVRNALWDALTSCALPCEASTGGETKYNRERLKIPKTHALDAACTGAFSQLDHWQIPTLQIRSMGRGSYQRTRSNRFGFPRGFLTRQKRVCGFQTGDHIKASVPKGKKKGNYNGRVAVRATGNFNIQTANGLVEGIHYRYCQKIQRADGYCYSTLRFTNNAKGFNIQNTQLEEQRFLPALNDRVSALSIG